MRTNRKDLAALLAASLLGGAAQAETPQQFLAQYSADARRAVPGFAPSPQRGRELFAAKHGGEWSCATCHGDARQLGEHAATGKRIQPLSPVVNRERFTDPAKVAKWFRRNCRDVLERECSAAEKADVLAWLMAGGR